MQAELRAAHCALDDAARTAQAAQAKAAAGAASARAAADASAAEAERLRADAAAHARSAQAAQSEAADEAAAARAAVGASAAEAERLRADAASLRAQLAERAPSGDPSDSQARPCCYGAATWCCCPRQEGGPLHLTALAHVSPDWARWPCRVPYPDWARWPCRVPYTNWARWPCRVPYPDWARWPCQQAAQQQQQAMPRLCLRKALKSRYDRACRRRSSCSRRSCRSRSCTALCRASSRGCSASSQKTQRSSLLPPQALRLPLPQRCAQQRLSPV